MDTKQETKEIVRDIEAVKERIEELTTWWPEDVGTNHLLWHMIENLNSMQVRLNRALLRIYNDEDES
jgi:hypothetical protein